MLEIIGIKPEDMTDLQLVIHYHRNSTFVNPRLLGLVSSRGLYNVINFVPRGKEGEAVIYARMAQLGKVFGDDEIDYVAGKIQRLESLRKELVAANITESHIIDDLLTKMAATNKDILDYFKQ